MSSSGARKQTSATSHQAAGQRERGWGYVCVTAVAAPQSTSHSRHTKHQTANRHGVVCRRTKRETAVVYLLLQVLPTDIASREVMESSIRRIENRAAVETTSHRSASTNAIHAVKVQPLPFFKPIR